MKKKLLLIIAFIATMNVAMAQIIQDNVLKSWSDASGDIRIPDEVVEIAANCFATINSSGWDSEMDSNIDITSVDLNNVKKIGKQAFMGCTGIKSIIANNLEVVDESAFDGCISLTSLNLPAIKTLGKTSFANNSDLTSVNLGNTLTSITGNPFRNCSMMANLTMATNGTIFEVINNALINKTTKTLAIVAGNTTEVNIPADKCTAVGEEAMYGCAKLARIELPGVTTIGNKALTMCTALKDLIVPNLISVNDDSFIAWQGVGQLTTVDIHLSENFDSFGYTFNNNAQTNIYVANTTIQAKLQKSYSKCTVIVGAPPTETKTYKLTFAGTPEHGRLEAWTTGGVDVPNGTDLTENAMVRVKATPYYGYEIEKWTVNGVDLTEELPSEGTFGQIYTVDAMKENVDVFVTFKELPQGYTIFFKSRMPEYGTLTCKTDAGKEVKYGDIVPVDCQLIFTATPNSGYRVTDWFKEVDNNGQISWLTLEDQHGKATYTCTPEDAMDIQVTFERELNTYVVKYESLNEYGSVSATANGEAINSGVAVKEGSKIVFTASPIEGYVVDSWIDANDDWNEIIGEKELTYTVENLNRDLYIALVCSLPTTEEPTDAVINGDHLVSWEKATGDVTVPEKIVYIDPLAFMGAQNLKSVMIGKNVKSIGERAFLYCGNLENITVDPENPYLTDVDGVVYNKEKTCLIAYPIGRKATNYEVLYTTQSIQPGAFSSAISLETISVPENNTALKAIDGALYTINGKNLLCFPTANITLTDVVLPDGVENIERLALVYSPVIKNIKFPASLKKIKAMGMSYNHAFSIFGWGEGITPALEEIGDSAFFYNRSLAILPYCPSLKTINKGAFEVCSMLEEVHIPASCTMIGENAFAKCEAIKNVFAYAENPLAIEANTFTDIVFLNEATLYTPIGCADKYKVATGWKVFSQIKDTLPSTAGIDSMENNNNTFTVYTLNGVKVRSNAKSLEGLAKGIYIINNKTVVVK